jgi:hypothetical protein
MQTQQNGQISRFLVECGSAQINKEKELIKWWMTFVGSRVKYWSLHLKEAFPFIGTQQIAESDTHMWAAMMLHHASGCPYFRSIACYRSGKKIFEFSLDQNWCSGPGFVTLETQHVGFVSDGLQLFINAMVEKVPQLRDDFQPFIDAAKRATRTEQN